MGSLNAKQAARLKRKKRIRKKVMGTSEHPRLTVFRSAKHIYSQIIDDTKGITLVAAASNEKEVQAKPDLGNKVAVAGLVGKLIAERAIGQGIKTVVFDRNGFMYHGRVKAVSEGAREAGLVF
ncbi:50S ribosomal protein L18 [Thermodesulfobacteriota bacterium]